MEAKSFRNASWPDIGATSNQPPNTRQQSINQSIDRSINPDRLSRLCSTLCEEITMAPSTKDMRRPDLSKLLLPISPPRFAAIGFCDFCRLARAGGHVVAATTTKRIGTDGLTSRGSSCTVSGAERQGRGYGLFVDAFLDAAHGGHVYAQQVCRMVGPSLPIYIHIEDDGTWDADVGKKTGSPSCFPSRRGWARARTARRAMGRRGTFPSACRVCFLFLLYYNLAGIGECMDAADTTFIVMALVVTYLPMFIPPPGAKIAPPPPAPLQ